MFEQILAFDNLIHQKVLALGLSQSWIEIFTIISALIWLIFAIYICYFAFIKKKERWKAIILSLGVLLVSGLVQILKIFFHRIRPDGSDDLSFPSRHAALAFFLLFALPWKRNEKILIAILAVLISASRIFLDLHYLSDVVVGAVIGTVCGLALRHKELLKKLM